MPCFKPLQGYRSKHLTRAGKRRVVFSKQDGYADLPVEVPCGRCIGCRLERSRQWAMRCMHESQLHDDNSFLTLTYDDENLPHGGTLVKRHYQLFMKRLREHIAPRKVRYYMCGEYGGETHRPHYHALLFGYNFPDLEFYKSSRGGGKLFRSELAEKKWQLGQVLIGEVTFESAAYVARYVMKKHMGEGAEEHYQALDPRTGELHQILPEYTEMSRNKGIGHGWMEQFKFDVYPEDQVVINGKLVQPPRYYDDQLSEEERETLKRNRRQRAAKQYENNTPERLAVREECAEARIFKRGL